VGVSKIKGKDGKKGIKVKGIKRKVQNKTQFPDIPLPLLLPSFLPPPLSLDSPESLTSKQVLQS
jgi:hypothetical protein